MFGPAFGLDLVSGFRPMKANVKYAYADTENYRNYLEFLMACYEGL